MFSAIQGLLRHKRFPQVIFALAVVLFYMKAITFSFSLMLLAFMLVFMPKPIARITAIVKGARVEMRWCADAIGRWMDKESPTAFYSPTYDLCWYIVAVGYFVCSLLPAVIHSITFERWSMNVLGAAITALGVVECARRAYEVFRRTWIRLTGKVVWGVIAAGFTCVASAWARKFTFDLTGIEPTVFPSFTTFVAIFLLPMTWWGMFYIVGLTWATFEIIIKLLGLLTSSAKDSAALSNETAPEYIDRFIGFLRPLSVIAALIYLTTNAPSLDPSESPTLRQLSTHVLVYLEYWPRPVCGFDKNVLASKIDATHYSVASAEGLATSINTITCKPAPP